MYNGQRKQSMDRKFKQSVNWKDGWNEVDRTGREVCGDCLNNLNYDGRSFDVGALTGFMTRKMTMMQNTRTVTLQIARNATTVITMRTGRMSQKKTDYKNGVNRNLLWYH